MTDLTVAFPLLLAAEAGVSFAYALLFFTLYSIMTRENPISILRRWLTSPKLKAALSTLLDVVLLMSPALILLVLIALVIARGYA